MGTHYNHINSNMYPLCFEQNVKNNTIFNLKIIIFTAFKNHCILHGRVYVIKVDISHNAVSKSD